MRGTAQFLDQLPGAVGVPTGGVQQGFAEGVAISLLANAGPLLPAHVFVFLLEVRAKPQKAHSSRGAVVVVVVQPFQKHSTTPTVRSSVRKLWMPSWCVYIYTHSFANPLCGLQELWKGMSLSVSSSSSSSSTSSALSSDQSKPRGQVVGEAVRPPRQETCMT